MYVVETKNSYDYPLHIHLCVVQSNMHIQQVLFSLVVVVVIKSLFIYKMLETIEHLIREEPLVKLIGKASHDVIRSKPSIFSIGCDLPCASQTKGKSNSFLLSMCGSISFCLDMIPLRVFKHLHGDCWIHHVTCRRRVTRHIIQFKVDQGSPCT